MLEILEQPDTARYAPLPEIPTGAELHVVEAMENGAVAGHAVFALVPGCVFVYTCHAAALELFDGLARTVLFRAALRGIARGEFRFADDRLQRLHLADENGVCADINRLLGGCESCRHAEN